MAENLAPVYVNESRVRLEGEPKPKVAKIVSVAGHRPDMCQVFRLRGQEDPQGRPLTIEDFIDRTAESNPVYLKVIERFATPAGTAAPPGGPTPSKPPGMAPRPGGQLGTNPPPANPAAPPPGSPGQGSDAPRPAPARPDRRPEPGHPAEQPKTQENRAQQATIDESESKSEAESEPEPKKD